MMEQKENAVLDKLAEQVSQRLAGLLKDQLADIRTAVVLSAGVLDDLLKKNEECRTELLLLKAEVEELRHSHINREAAVRQWRELAGRYKARAAELAHSLGEQQLETGRLRELNKRKND